MAKLVSINVSEVQTVEYKGKTVHTGIYKKPVHGKQQVQGVNIVGDDQGDRRVHGGTDKAIYGYPQEHYSFWKQPFPDMDYTTPGVFGENLTTKGILEKDIFVGDRLKIGTVILEAVQPRFPCSKLGMKFGTNAIVKEFRQSDMPGIYFRIVEEGEFEAGDDIEVIPNPQPKVTIVDLYHMDRGSPIEVLKRLELALEEPAIPSGWREEIIKERDNLQSLLNSGQ